MNSAANLNELLQAFELTDQIIANARIIPWANPILPTLVNQRKEMLVVLDKATCSQSRRVADILAERRERETLHPRAKIRYERKTGYRYKNEFYPCGSYLEMHRKLLRHLFIDFPEKRDAMVSSLWRIGYNRSYIAETREELFHKSMNPRSVRKYSRPLVDGWYIDVNVTPERINKILPRVVQAAGLIWEADVSIIWVMEVRTESE